MHVCVVTACVHVLWPRPDIYCNYYVRAKFKPGGAPGCYDARGNTDICTYVPVYCTYMYSMCLYTVHICTVCACILYIYTIYILQYNSVRPMPMKVGICLGTCI